MPLPSPSPSPVLVESLRLECIRNLRRVECVPAARLNLIFGKNGHGKTSLIEALYILATTRSFRAARLLETIQEGESAARLTAQVSAAGLRHQLQATLAPRGRSFLLNGKRPARQLSYALTTPIIVFHPGDLALVSGPATLRRSLLDRILVHSHPLGAAARLRYQEAQKERHRLLQEKGWRAPELDAYEAVVAEQGARFAAARAEVAARVIESVLPAFSQMADPSLRLEARYLPGGCTDRELFQRELAERRLLDQRRKSASFGPHRDELELRVEGRAARTHASQGQQRILTLSLKIAELAAVRAVTRVEPVLLLDDVSSELDPERTAAVFQFLRETRSQVFVTTTRPELFQDIELDPAQRADFHMLEGQLLRVESSPKNNGPRGSKPLK